MALEAELAASMPTVFLLSLQPLVNTSGVARTPDRVDVTKTEQALLAALLT